MKFVGNILYLEFAEMVTAGVSKQTLWLAKHRNSSGWNFINDPADKRKVLIQYETLKDIYKSQVNDKFGDPYLTAGAEIIKPLLKTNQTALKQLREFTLENGESLPTTYIDAYSKACDILEFIATTTLSDIKRIGFPNKSAFDTAITALIRQENLPLPKAYSRLQQKVKQYKTDGAHCVISKKFGNQNTAKINAAISDWLIAQYAQSNKPDTEILTLWYLQAARENQWPAVTESAIYQHLKKPDIKPMWYMGRHGLTEWKRKYERTNKLFLPTVRDAMWIGDGTKLDFYYQDSKGAKATLKIYIIGDVYSEKILGYDVAFTEDFKSQYRASKMALQTAGAKPYQWLYDGQGGHVKKESQDFMTRATTKRHFRSRPYRSSGRSIEQMFNRFQQKVLRRYWFSTGQSVKGRNLNNRPNMDFIKSKIKQLPCEAEIRALVPTLIDEWNEGTHPRHNKSRNELYATSVNPEHNPLEIWDMVDLFWHITQKPSEYRKSGLKIQVSNCQYEYEVQDENGNPDVEFMSRNIGRKFTVKYDPDDMSAVRLYTIDHSLDLRFVAEAKAKEVLKRALIDHEPGDRARVDALMKAGDDHVEAIAEKLERIRKRAKVDPDDVLTFGHLATKEELQNAESEWDERMLEPELVTEDADDWINDL